MSGTRRGSAAILLIATLSFPRRKRPGAAGATATAGCASAAHELLRHQRRPRRWCEPGWPGGRRQALPDTGAGRRSGQSHMARVSQPDCGGCDTACQRARPNRQRSLVQREGCHHRGQRRRAHGDSQRDRNNIRKPIALNEKGKVVTGSGDTPNVHDILTGSDSHGRVLIGRPDVTTCGNWTSNAAGSAMVGHHDRLGGPNASSNAVHLTNGCSQQNLVSTGGAGLLYCFAAN